MEMKLPRDIIEFLDEVREEKSRQAYIIGVLYDKKEQIEREENCQKTLKLKSSDVNVAQKQ